MPPDPTENTELQLTPKFTGPRFEHHSIPLEMLPDLGAYRDLVKEVAKDLYKREHPDRKRVPSAFENTFRLSLKAVNKGSAVAALVNDYAVDDDSNVVEFSPFFGRAKAIVDDTIRMAADPAGAVPLEFPSRLLSKFGTIGRNLKSGEYIDFGYGTPKPAPFSESVRETLVLWATDEIERRIEVVGIVTDLHNDPVDSFNLKLEEGNTVMAPHAPDMKEEVFSAFRNPRTSSLKVKGHGIFNRQNRLLKVTSIVELETLDGESLALYRAVRRVREMANLPIGWCNGQGGPLSVDAVAWVIDVLTTLVETNGIPTPTVFPTPKGEIQMEWDWKGGSADARLLFATKTASFAAFTDSADTTADVSLATPDDVTAFAKLLDDIVPVGGLES